CPRPRAPRPGPRGPKRCAGQSRPSRRIAFHGPILVPGWAQRKGEASTHPGRAGTPQETVKGRPPGVASGRCGGAIAARVSDTASGGLRGGAGEQVVDLTDEWRGPRASRPSEATRNAGTTTWP